MGARADARPAARHGAIAAVVVLQVGIGMPVFLVATLAPYIRVDIGLDERTLGLGIALFYAASSASAVWLGRVADRQPWERGLLVAATGLVAALLLVGGAVWSVPALLAVLAGAALVQSLAVGTANLALFRVVPPHRQGIAFGVKHAAVPAAMLLAGLAAPLVADRIGWRWAFLLAAAFPVLAAALVAWRARARPPGGGRPTDPHAVPELGAAPRTGPGPRVPRRERRRLRTLAAAAGLGAFTSGSLAAFFVLFGVSEGMAPATAGLVVAASSALNVTVRVLVGAAVDRFGWHPFRLSGWLLAGGAAGFLLLAGEETARRMAPADVSSAAAGGAALFAGAALAYGAGWAWQGLLHLGAVRFWPQAPGYATGVVRTGIAAGAGTGPLVSGLLIGAAGYSAVWLLLAVLATAAAGGLLLVASRRAGAYDNEEEPR